MAGNSTDLIAEFQKLRQETSGISKNLMTNHISSSSPSDETLKLVVGSLRSIRSELAEMKVNQKKEQDDQNQKITKVIEMLESIRGEMTEIKEKQAAQEGNLEKLLEATSLIDKKLALRIEDEFTGTWDFVECEITDAQKEAISGRYWLRHAQMFEIEDEKFSWWSVSGGVASLRTTSVLGARNCSILPKKHLYVLVKGIPQSERMDVYVEKGKLHIDAPFGKFVYKKEDQ